MSISWALVLVGYLICLIILDFIWFAGKIPKSVIIWSWKQWRKDRRYYERRHRWREKYREQMAKLRRKHRGSLCKELINKKILLTVFLFGWIIIFACWGFTVSGNATMLITLIIVMSLIIIFGVWEYRDEKKIIKRMRQEKIEKKKRELRRFCEIHGV